MASIRHNRVFLTIAMVVAITGGSLIALGARGLVWRSLGTALVALGLAMPFWISLGQNTDRRRRINTIDARQLDSVRRATDLAESMKDLQSEVRDLISQVGSLSGRLRGLEMSTGDAQQELVDNAQQEVLMRLRQLSMGLVELARHQDAARDELAALERRFAENSNNGDTLTR